MSHSQVLVILSILFSSLLQLNVFGDKIEQKIYQNLKGYFPCVTYLNATHQIGCTSKRKGNVGVIHHIKSDEDLIWLLDKGMHAPYIPLFNAEYFTDDRLKKLVDADKVAGALVAFDGTERGEPASAGFSPEYPCPKDNFGRYHGNTDYSCSSSGKKSVIWNKNGSGMSYRLFNVPVFALHDKSEVGGLVNCYEKHNKPVNNTSPDYPLCAVEMKSFMFAAKNTPTCMRRNEASTFSEKWFCDPLGDYNVWGTLFPLVNDDRKKDVILATAKLDSASFFYNLGPGADNDATGVVALLAAAEALGRLKSQDEIAAPDVKSEKHIMFAFFQGEVWDYIGSSRMVYDMMKGDFPCKGDNCYKVNVSNIAYFLELNQVGLFDEGAFWAHSDPLSSKSIGDNITRMFDVLKDFGSRFNLSIKNPSEKDEQPLPPASFQRFLRTNVAIPGLVITDHKKSYTNKFYNSRFDDMYELNLTTESRSILVQRLTRLASTMAHTLYHLAYNKSMGNITANEALVSDLLKCFLETANCSSFKNVLNEKEYKKWVMGNEPLNRYVGTFGELQYNVITEITGRLLANYAECWKNDEPTNRNISEMTGSQSGSNRINATVFLSPAKSPAFLLKDFTSREYSTWTESKWGNDLSVRMFLVADPAQEVITLVVGIVITLISAVVTVFLYTNANQLFASDDSVLVISDMQ